MLTFKVPWKNYANDNHSIVAFSLIKAKLLGEVGELVELFQWIGGEGLVQEVLSEETLDKAGQEIANVSIYLGKRQWSVGIHVKLMMSQWLNNMLIRFSWYGFKETMIQSLIIFNHNYVNN